MHGSCSPGMLPVSDRCRVSAVTRPAGVAGLEHMLPMERPFAWLCSLRPSDAAAHTLARLGPSLSQAQRTALEGLRVRA